MRIRIDGADHEIPDVDSFTIDESGILFDYSGITLDRYFDADPMNPRLHQAWLHILIRRMRPELTEAEVKQIVRETPHLSIFAPDAEQEQEQEDDAVPPGLSRPPTSSSGWPASTDGSTKPSGNGSANATERSPEPSPLGSSGLRHWAAGQTSEYETLAGSPPGSSTPATT